MSGDSDFTLRLIQDVSGPALAAKKSIQGLGGEFRKLGIDADAAWKKAVASAKSSMAKEHGNATQKGWQQQVRFAKQMAKDKERASLLAGKQVARNLNIQSGIDKKRQKHEENFLQKKSDHQGAIIEGIADTIATDGLYAIGAAAAAAAAAVGYLGYEFIKSTQAAVEFEQTSTKAIGFLTDNAPAAAGVFDDVRHEAQSLGLDVHETEESFQKLLAAQFSVGKSKDLIKMGADMKAIGADAEHVQRILYAMSEIKSMGTLQKRQERMLQMAGISGELIDQALMQKTGIKTKGGLDMARKKGKIGSDVAVDAVMEAVKMKVHEDNWGDRGKEMADGTIRGMKTELAAGIDNWFTDIGRALDPIEVGLAQHVKSLITDVAADPRLAAVGELLLLKFEAFGGWVDTNWPKIEDMLVGGFHMVIEAVAYGIDVVDFAIDHWNAIKDTLIGVGIVLGVLGAAAFFLIGGPLLVATGVITGVMVGIGALVSYIADSASTVYATAKAWGVNLYTGFLDGITGGLGLVTGAADMLGAAAGTAVAKAIKAHSPSELTYDLGGYFGEGFALGIDNSYQMVKGSAVGLADSAVDGVVKSSSVSLNGTTLDSGSSSRGGDRKIVFAPQYQINQQPGQDGEGFAKTVTDMVYGHFASFMDGLAIEGSPVEDMG